MSLSAQIKQLWQSQDTIAYRPPAVCAGATNIFAIVGPNLIKLIGGYYTALPGGATTLTVAVNGVNTVAAAVDIGTGGAIGEVWVSTLNVAGAMLGALGGLPLTDALLHSKGFLTGDSVGLIVATFAVANWTGSIFCVYQKLAPQSSIVPV